MFKNLFQISHFAFQASRDESNFKFQVKKGFTLLEMLVVIGIISVLVSIGFVSYSTAQKKARDAKRQSDLKSFQTALEQCYSVNGYTYPSINGDRTSTIVFACPGDGSSATITDPTTKIYTVTQDTDDNTYEVSLELELSETPITISQQQ